MLARGLSTIVLLANKINSRAIAIYKLIVSLQFWTKKRDYFLKREEMPMGTVLYKQAVILPS